MDDIAGIHLLPAHCCTYHIVHIAQYLNTHFNMYTRSERLSRRLVTIVLNGQKRSPFNGKKQLLARLIAFVSFDNLYKLLLHKFSMFYNKDEHQNLT